MSRMIDYIRDAIMYGLDKDFWSEDSCLVDGYYDCYDGLLNCESLSVWKDNTNKNVMHLRLGEGEQYKITIEEE